MFLLGAANHDDRRWRRPGAVRHPPPDPAAPHVRATASTSASAPRWPVSRAASRSTSSCALPRVGRRLRRRPPRTDVDRARLGDAPDRPAVTRTVPARRRVRQSGPTGAAPRRREPASWRPAPRSVRASSIHDWRARDDPRRRRTRGGERTHRLPALRERAGPARRGDGAPRDARRHRARGDGPRRRHRRRRPHRAAWSPGPRPARRRPVDPTLHDASRRQHEALLAAVGAETPGWSDADRRLAAALLDVLWSVGSYEHLAVDWGLDRDEAIRGTAWVIDLVTAAVRDGRAPALIRRAPPVSRARAACPGAGR